MIRAGIVCVAAMAGFVVAAAAEQADRPVRHPNLFVNADELRELRLKLETEKWRAQLFEDVKADAASGNLVASAVVYAVAEDEQAGNKVRNTLVQQAQGFVPKNPNAQYPWGPGAGDAIAFDLVAPLLTPDEQQAVTTYLRQLALDGIDYHQGHPLTPNMSFVCHWRIGLIGYAIGDPEIIEWAINDPGPDGWNRRPDVGSQKRNMGRWGGFKQRIEYTLTDGTFWDEATIYGNFSILGMMYLAEAARNYDGTDLYNYTSPDGGSLRKAIAGMVSLAYPIERTGVRGGSVRMATLGDGSTSPPNRINSEAGDAYFVNKPNVFPERQNLFPIIELAYHAWKDPMYAWLLSLNSSRKECLGWFEYVPVTLLLGETLPPQNPPVGLASAIYPETAIAVLRSDESPSYWTSRGIVAIQQMGRSYMHEHRDKFEIMLWGRGRLLYPDWNAHQYEAYQFGWTRNGWAHSTLIVDESNPKGGAYTERHDFNPDVKFLATTSNAIYDNVTQTRALLLTNDYLLDFFGADSPRERTYDWFIHGIGRVSLPFEEAFQPSTDLLKPYHWIDKERKLETDQTWSADFVQSSGGVIPGMGAFTDEWFNAKVGVRMTLLGEPGTTAYAGDGLFNPTPNLREYGNPEGTIPLVMARRKAKTTCFAAMHEPYEDGPRLSIHRLCRASSHMSVRVTGPDFTDYACLAYDARPNSPLSTITFTDTLGGDAEGYFSFNNYAWMRVKAETIIARGGWHAFRVFAPAAAAKGALALNGKPASYRKDGSYVVFEEAAGTVSKLLPIALNTTCTVERNRVVPGETLKLVLAVQNSGTGDAPESKATLAAANDWKSDPVKLESLKPGASTKTEMTLTIPPDASPGTSRDLRIRIDSANQTFNQNAGQILVVPKFSLSFSPERICVGKNKETTVDLIATNNAPDVQELSAQLTVPDGIVAGYGRLVAPIEPGEEGSATIFLTGGSKDLAGEIIAKASGSQARLPVSVGVTIAEEDRHPLFPMWVVRAPAYQIRIHRKFGTSRTITDGHGQFRYGSEWWGGSGIIEVRLPTGAEETAPICWNKNAKELRWDGHTLELTAESGEKLAATFGENAIRYRFTGQDGIEYRAGIQSFFRHTGGIILSPNQNAPAGIPPVIDGLYWSGMKNPDLSPDCVLIFTPRQAATWSDRPTNTSVSWLLRNGEEFVLGFGPETAIPALLRE